MELRENVLELLGVLVVAYEEGLQLGNVSDIYIDKKSCQITGISLKKGLPGYVHTSYVDFKSIRKMGTNVVIVASKAAASPVPKGIENTSLRLLKNVRVATQGGEYVGKLFDVNVDVASGSVSQIMLSENQIVDIEPGTTAIGSDIIVLPSALSIRSRKVEERKTDGNKNIDAMTNLLESARSKVIEVAKGTTRKVIQTTKRAARTSGQATRAATRLAHTAKNAPLAARKPTRRGKKAARKGKSR